MARAKSYFLIFVGVVFGFVVVSASLAGEAMIKPEAVPAYQPKLYPFESGEKEVYLATWNGMLSVATAEVHTVAKMVDGKKVYQVRVDAKTSPTMDLFWKMRDTISSTFDAKALAPSKFTFNQRENSRVIDTEARFDHGVMPIVLLTKEQESLFPLRVVSRLSQSARHPAKTMRFEIGKDGWMRAWKAHP